MSRSRRYPLLMVTMVAVGGLFAFGGTLLGALWLATIWGILTPSALNILIIQQHHPSFQVYGFVYVFVMGVSLTLIPRFKNKATPLGAASLSCMLVIGGIFAFAVSRPLADSMLVAGGIVYTYTALRILGRPKGYLAMSEYFIGLSAVSLSATFVLKALGDFSLAEGKGFAFDFLQVALLGFPTAMIFGVELRTIHFRVADMRKGPARIAFPLAASGLLVPSLGFLGLAGDELPAISPFLLLLAALLVATAIRVFEETIPPPNQQRMEERDRVRYRYFTRALRFAYVWLILGLTLDAVGAVWRLWSGSMPFGLRDSFIHSVAVGFIGSTIIAYAPILLPTLIRGHVPYRGLSRGPLYLLTIGNGIRIVGSLMTDIVGPIFWLAAFSGPLILAAMIWFMLMVHRLRREAPPQSLVQIKQG